MEINDPDFVSLVEDNLSGTAIVIGILQGVLDSELIGHEGMAKLDAEDIFDEDPHTTITNLMGYLSESLGNDALLSILASLIGVGILAIDPDKFYHYHDVTDDDIKNDLN
jgi:hypothetical protein